MLWIKAFHIIAMVTWFAGLFYLPRLFVYHTMAHDEKSRERFSTMERKLYFYIMTPGAILTILLGIGLTFYHWDYYLHAAWLHAKLLLVAMLILFHLYCGKLLKTLARNNNRHNDRFYRWINEIPTVLLIGIVILAVVKPF